MDPQENTYENFYRGLFSDILCKPYNEPSKDGGGGRIYQTPADLAEACIKYFLFCHYNKEIISMEGLRLHLRLWSQPAFYSYKNIKQYGEDFKTVVERVQLYIEKLYHDKLFNPSSMAAAKFVLQCKYGSEWVPTEKQIVENHDITVTIGKAKEEDEEHIQGPRED